MNTSTLNQNLKSYTQGNFQIVPICKNIVICEARVDRHNWGNATGNELAFLAYVGCQKNEVPRLVKTLNTFYELYWCEVRKPKYFKEYESEVKIRGMKRYSDKYGFGLDHLISSEGLDNHQISSDEYDYYTTGYMPRH